jgi:predicted double-glycine peptidase
MFSVSKKYFSALVALFLLIPSYDALAFNFKVAGVRLNKDIKPLREIKREHVVQQSLDYSCGPAGLSTLLNYYLDDKITEREIIETLFKTVPFEKVRERRGFSLLDLKKFTQSKGYVVTAYKMSTKFLAEREEPVLVPIKFKNFQHFVIVKDVIGDRVFIADPAAGNVTMKVKKFEKLWINGIGLIVEKNKNDKKPLVSSLKVNDNDIVIADYKMLRRLTEAATFRATFYPGEF